MSTGISRAAEERRYVREIEKHFLVRRGSPLLLSPRDWALAVSWFEQGIPLSAVLSGIDEVFDRLEETGAARGIRSLSYCRHAIEERWEDARRRLTVDGGPEDSPATAEQPERADRLAGAFRKVARSLGRLASRSGREGECLARQASEIEALAGELIGASADQRRSLEARLDKADREILDALRAVSSPDLIQRTEREAVARLAPHRPHMPAKVYRATLARAVDNRLREHHGIPRLGLLFLD
jgi:hypothetical protein